MGARSRSMTARSPARSSASGPPREVGRAREIAGAIGARIVVEGADGTPVRAVIDSSAAGEGDLFFGLRGRAATAASSPRRRSRQAPGAS